MAARKRGYGSKPYNADEDLKNLSEYTHEGIKDYDIKENKKNFLRFRKKPYLEWGVGITLIAAAVFCEWFLITLQLSWIHFDAQHWFISDFDCCEK